MKNVSAIGAFIIALLLFGGCDGVSGPNAKGKKNEIETTETLLLGTWRREPPDVEFLVFEEGGKFTLISVGNDTTIFPGKFSVIDSMIHTTLFENNTPTEEVWLRLRYAEDSIVLYKGVMLKGLSSNLVGDWDVESTVEDSSGQLYLYQFNFMDDGLLVQTGPGYVDTSAYSFHGSSVTLFDKSNGKVKMNLGYEIRDGRLSLYNLGAREAFYRVR